MSLAAGTVAGTGGLFVGGAFSTADGVASSRPSEILAGLSIVFSRPAGEEAK